jgi:glucose/arabinose dehydrogenase
MIKTILRRAFCCLLLAAPLSVVAQTTPPGVLLPNAGAPLTLAAGQKKIRVVLVAEGLVGPWDIVFIPGTNDMLVTESSGALRLIANGQLVPAPVWTSPSPKAIDVLHGVVIHPDFATNRFVYVSYFKGDATRQTLAISRGRFDGAKLVDAKEIFVAEAWLNATVAFAGRMEFGPDKTLYVTVGDRDNLCCGATDDNSVRILAQSLASDIGKTLRLTDDGGIPKDNPFVGRADARPEIFTYGHRNGFGLRFHPETGELWQMEIGPLGGDEINILKPGANYGWPLVSQGRNYSGTLVSEQPWYREGMVQPRMYWVPAISPAGMAFYTGDKFPDWKNNLIIGALSGKHVQRVSFDHPTGHAERREVFLDDLGVRFREVEMGPDGYIYLATEVRYGSGQPDGTVLRLEPAR